MPAQKAFSPRPVRIATRRSGSAWNSAKPASMPTSISRVKAFSASGRSIVKIAI
jgi:hypothetical protein